MYRNGYDKIKKNDVDDVVLFNEKGEITESTVCNIVIKDKEKYFTPFTESGLLNGTFRQYLIDQKKIGEKNIFKEDLFSSDQIYLVNSVQQWCLAEFK